MTVKCPAQENNTMTRPKHPEMHVNEIHLPRNRHHKVSSLMKFNQNTQNYVKYEVYENV